MIHPSTKTRGKVRLTSVRDNDRMAFGSRPRSWSLRHEAIVWQRRPVDPFLRSLAHAFDQIGADTPITSVTVFIANRPLAATTAAAAVFLTPWRVRAPP